jgi:quercetin dioxygenase-like cupin family protein
MTKQKLAKPKLALIAGAAAVVTVLAGVALATPGFNVVGTIAARAGFADRVDIMFKLSEQRRGTDVIHVRNAQDTVMQQIVFGPGGHSGWHSHPGPAVVLVTQGELTLYSGEDPTCTGRTYSAGQAFIDPGQGHVHLARASQTGDTVVWVTYFDVPPGSGVRIDADDPGNCVF